MALDFPPMLIFTVRTTPAASCRPFAIGAVPMVRSAIRRRASAAQSRARLFPKTSLPLRRDGHSKRGTPLTVLYAAIASGVATGSAPLLRAKFRARSLLRIVSSLIAGE